MIRRRIFRSVAGNHFNHRGKEIFRIEALSDALFAFSVSLLVASLEVPKTFNELKAISAGAIPFFATVTMIFFFWYRQYLFFRRYGLNDFTTILLNLIYLAVILFYLYPLKFLFSVLLSYWSGINFSSEAGDKSFAFLSSQEFPQLIILFSAGYFLVWTIIYLSYRHVLKMTHRFDFSRFELEFTKKEKKGALWNAAIGIAALVFAWVHQQLIASLCYFLIPIVMFINDYRLKRSIFHNKQMSKTRSHRIAPKAIQ